MKDPKKDQEKAQRLAEALRENLKKRKAQSRLRGGAEKPASGLKDAAKAGDKEPGEGKG